MAVKLHRCPHTWIKLSGHPCWRVQKALDEMGVEYEIVPEPWPSRKKRTAVIEATGQSGLPAIELEDGTLVPRAIGGNGARDPGRALRPGRLSGATLSLSRGYSSVGRAPGSHPGGRRFESA